MKWILPILLALSIGANVGLALRSFRAPSPIDPGGPPPRHGRPSLDHVMDRHLEQMAVDLELDAGQQATIRDAHESLFPLILEAHESVDGLRDEAVDVFKKVNDTPDLFREHVRRLQSSQARLDSLLTEVLLAEAAVLNADQRDRYIKISPWSSRPGAPPPRKGPPPR